MSDINNNKEEDNKKKRSPPKQSVDDMKCLQCEHYEMFKKKRKFRKYVTPTEKVQSPLRICEDVLQVDDDSDIFDECDLEILEILEHGGSEDVLDSLVDFSGYQPERCYCPFCESYK